MGNNTSLRKSGIKTPCPIFLCVISNYFTTAYLEDSYVIVLLWYQTISFIKLPLFEMNRQFEITSGILRHWRNVSVPGNRHFRCNDLQKETFVEYNYSVLFKLCVYHVSVDICNNSGISVGVVRSLCTLLYI